MKFSRQGMVEALRRAVKRGEKVPAGVRSAIGVLLMIAGVFGILPVLGFWMLPVGAAFIALDVPPLRRRLEAWLHRGDGGRKEKGSSGEPATPPPGSHGSGTAQAAPVVHHRPHQQDR